MSDIIERAAIAACEGLWSAEFPDDPDTWEQAGDDQKEHFRAAARAVLHAIREPNQKMMTALWDGWGDFNQDAKERWQTMIDVALGDAAD